MNIFYVLKPPRKSQINELNKSTKQRDKANTEITLELPNNNIIIG